ncbi:hypothetical protein EBN03_25930 [Nocardia stercoris]|uniref:Uncharacterized protein n=2 Tax=Nocardia stercoris TaxID=2483361 RepID=A0A3M2KZ15_9NOCA|nr:hypothetical protein EBN03_25930 [Nocardia stercoris]
MDSGATQNVSLDSAGGGDSAALASGALGYGGLGGMTNLSLVRGGMGSMPGTASGFRMPGSWQNGGKAFGAGTAVEEPEPIAPRRAVSVTGPRNQRRRDPEKRSGKVIVPGEPEDVPVLELPPEIGVIGYSLDDQEA